jgi:hypothetical protein
MTIKIRKKIKNKSTIKIGIPGHAVASCRRSKSYSYS